MNWQVKGMKTSWIRVLTPDAGSSGKVSSNRGFVFIPEKGDQVMIGFHYNDPNRPYVQGSLFNGKNAGGGGADNNVKSLTTRSGATIALDDKKGSITLRDSSGSTIILNGDNTITIQSADKITFESKEIEIKGKEKVSISSEAKLSLQGENSIISGASSMQVLGDTQVGIDAPSLGVGTSSTTSLKIEGSTVEIDGRVMTNVKGTILNLN